MDNLKEIKKILFVLTLIFGGIYYYHLIIIYPSYSVLQTLTHFLYHSAPIALLVGGSIGYYLKYIKESL